MAGIRGVKNPMPKKGGATQNLFSTEGKQKNPPLGDSYMPQYTGSNYRKPRKDPVKRDNGLK